MEILLLLFLLSLTSINGYTLIKIREALENKEEDTNEK